MADSNVQLSRILSSRLEDIPLFADELELWGETHGLPRKVINSVNLMLDELITNIVKYGYKGQPDGKIELHIALVEESIDVTVRDYGPPFNLLDVKEPDVSQDLEERSVGGLGIFFVRQLADQIFYRRDGDTNEVRLRKSTQ